MELVDIQLRVFGDFLRFTYIENHGGIFGIFQGHIIIFTIIKFSFNDICI